MQKQDAPNRPQNRLKELRDQQDLKLYDISALVRVDPATVHRWETGDTRTVPDDAKFAMAKLYGVSVEYLMGWDREAA